MTYNDLTHDYIPLAGYKNVISYYPKGESYVCPPTIDPNIVLLIDILVRERPMWSFEHEPQTYILGRSVPHNISRFVVLEGGETLGSIWLETYNGARLHYDNTRLHSKRQRGGSSFSSKPAIAAKGILKAFHRDTPKERAAAAFSGVQSAVSKHTQEAHWKFSRKWNSLDTGVLDYVVDNWALFTDYMAQRATAVPEGFLEAHQTKKEASEISEAINNAKALTVIVEGSGYLTSREYASNRAVMAYTNDTLPERLRAPLGLLKMVEDNTVVAGIGLRVSSTTFLILDEEDTSGPA